MKHLALLGVPVAALFSLVAACSSSSSSTPGGSPEGGADSSTESDSSTPVDSGGAVDSGSVDSGAPVDSGTAETGHDAAPEASTPDAGGDADAGDPCKTPPTTTFYVDATNGSDTNTGGGPACALKTITAALTASTGAAHDGATIHVAAGTYGAGETFPLVVDHGRSIVGAGASVTTIQGASAASYATTNTGSLLDTGTHYVSIVTGDAVGDGGAFGPTTLSGFTLLPPSTVTTPTTGYLGIVCLAGNAPNTGAKPPLPAASLLVDSITAGPNFDVALVLASEPKMQTACNALVTSSTFTGSNVGITTGTCGTTNPVQSWPSAQIGDGTAGHSNVFSSSVIDVFGEGCGSAQSIDKNDFQSGYRGVVIVSPAAQYFEILNNAFDGASTPLPMGMGVQTSATGTIAKLNGNSFTNISESAGADTAVGGTTGFALAVGAVLQAHGNSIHDNDNGISVGVAPTASFDFSASTSADANHIYCNSKGSGGSGNGYDLLLAYTGGLAANFAGNVWDHAPPTSGTSLTTTANGTDDVTGASAGVTTTGATAVSTVTCASGRVQ